MRIFAKYFTILALLGIGGFLVYRIVHTLNKKSLVKERISTLPPFNFYTLNNTHFGSDSLIKDKSTVIIYFNTGCEHCQYETNQILKNAETLQKSNFLLVSSESENLLRNFYRQYNLSAFPFVRLLRDADNIMYQIFGAKSVPTIFIYAKNGHLLKKYDGEVKIEALIDAVK
ncbi:redoxin domain-containing protein [Niabella yanshanensis]|uniref:Redoxin domain-containing protein n=1 Tax=Niabella yanshanensis TaxID=577386 RepID=A0ABZ0W4Q0_9BACT|nr:redoxin domain-containing protein [Niabella yanshanensis]WQD38101.1 redoxin domain-containing protein [Niabella yanshanensis]